ncbi:hypothetical protein CN311_16130 [Mesorhizobium sanjuanii]|uniref:Uncharacterized protein n=1 Tax=Mesorhizobium sanjuanii TaxID=2037900 RepID=A0A2A6FED9_9HYPH|nr:hypothetical protein CN311_16130 [Mesorhizobium sanjuanii]
MLDDDYFKHRKRLPSVKKIALIAIAFFLRPAPEEQSACSDYACVLEHAYAQHVAHDELAEWLLRTGFNACKEAVRAKRMSEKLARTSPPHVEALPGSVEAVPELSSLEVTSHDTERGVEHAVKFQCPLGLIELIAPKSNAARLPELLRQLADHLERTASQNGEYDA